MWILYELLYILGFILYLPSALRRRRLPHAGWRMRLGRYPAGMLAPLGGRRPVWIHAVSVGETLAVRPLLRALKAEWPGDPIVLSSITPSGYAVASQQGADVCVYVPLDLRGPITRAFDAVRPSCLLLVESELWPMLLRQAAARNIPVAVVNGRVSPRTFKRYQLLRPWLRGPFGCVRLFLMQSQQDADRLATLGVPAERIRVTGSLKWEASKSSAPEPAAVSAVASRLGLNGSGPVITAGSTHRGEEALILDAFRAVRSSYPGARLILAPRHLERLDDVEELVRQSGLTGVRTSASGASEWDVAVVDVFGQLPLFYAVSTVAIIGGSFIPHGGQNPLEAASQGKPVVYGPSMHNFEAISHQLLAHHAARQAGNDGELTLVLKKILEHPDEAAQMGARARQLTEQFQGATQRILDALREIFAR